MGHSRSFSKHTLLGSKNYYGSTH